MDKLYDRIDWRNNTTPALNATNLNAMSKAIDDIDDRVLALGANVLEVIPQIQIYLDQAEDLVEAMENLSKHPPYIGANGDWYVWDTDTSTFVDSGIDASITVTIADVTAIGPNDAPYVTNSGTDTDPIFHLFIPRGQTGSAGNGIASITKTSSSGNVDTYTILYTNGGTDTFTVTNGTGGVDYLSQLLDVALTSPTDGQVLKYNATTQKWENGAGGGTSADDVSYDNTSSGLTATNVQDAIDEVVTDVDNLSTEVDDKHTSTTLAVSLTGWATDTTSQSGTTLYKKQISLTHVYVDSPSVDIGAGTGYVLPTSAEQKSYNLIQYVTVDDTVPCLYLYASEIPTTAFYIKVTGVE